MPETDSASGVGRPPLDLAALYTAHRLSLARLALLLVDDMATAEDVVHDAFIALQQHQSRLRDPAAAIGYLRTTVVNKARSVLRKRQTVRRHLSLARDSYVDPADSELLLAEGQREVLAAVRQLPRRQQEVLALRYWEVPWSAVGTGWRLLQQHSADLSTVGRNLYLYDPADGRYLITDRLPAGARLVGWSPDGARAMLQAVHVTKDQSGSYKNESRLYQLELRSGTFKQVLMRPELGFVGYTQPRGLAFLAQQSDSKGVWRLYRYSTDGSLELSYPAVIDGHALSSDIPRYTPDGTKLIVPALPDTILLIGNDGHFIRAFQPPTGYSSCQVVKLWSAEAMLESCWRPAAGSGSYAVLLVQPLSGSAPRVLIDAKGRRGDGYSDAWQLSNGDVLLENWADCGASAFDILDGTSGAVRPLRGPSGVAQSAEIIKMSGDLATFDQRTPTGCGNGTYRDRLFDYNLVTGRTTELVDRPAIIVSWPGDQS